MGTRVSFEPMGVTELLKDIFLLFPVQISPGYGVKRVRTEMLSYQAFGVLYVVHASFDFKSVLVHKVVVVVHARSGYLVAGVKQQLLYDINIPSSLGYGSIFVSKAKILVHTKIVGK